MPPLGIAYLAAVMEAKGHKVSIIDAFAERLDMHSLKERIKATASDVISVTGMTPVIDNAFRVVKAARKYAKHIIMGGPHVSVAGKKILNSVLT